MCLSSCQSVWPTRLPRANIKNQFHHKGSMFSVNTMKLNSEFRTRDVTIVTPFSEFRYWGKWKALSQDSPCSFSAFSTASQKFSTTSALRLMHTTQSQAPRIQAMQKLPTIGLRLVTMDHGTPNRTQEGKLWKLNRALTAPCISCLWRRSSQEQHRCGKEISFESKSSSARCKPHLKRAASCETPISGCGFALDAAEIPHVPRCLHGRLILR